MQGDIKLPFKQYTDVDVVRAIQTTLTQSSAEAATNIQANEQARSQQQAVQQAQEMQQQAPSLHR